MEIKILKVIVLLTLFLTCLIGSLLPLKFVNFVMKHHGGASRRRRVERAMRFLNCFGGGVFLATCLLDLLPDVERKLAVVLKNQNIHTNFPVATFITAVGLFLILTVEQIAEDCKEKASVKHQEAMADGKKETASATVSINSEEEKDPLLQPHMRSRPSQETSSASEESGSKYGNVETGEIPSHKNSHGDGHGHSHGHSHGALNDATSDEALIQHTESHDMVTSSSLRSLLLLLALSLHSVFEGLALGLQSDTDQLMGIFAAIVIHKTILALSLGINFVQSNLKQHTMIWFGICFAIMAPIGIIIGIVVISEFDTTVHNAVGGILQGLATGTFLYITFFEVLPMEMSQPGDRLLKVLCAMLGFSMIVGTLFLDPTITNPTSP